MIANNIAARGIAPIRCGEMPPFAERRRYLANLASSPRRIHVPPVPGGVRGASVTDGTTIFGGVTPLLVRSRPLPHPGWPDPAERWLLPVEPVTSDLDAQPERLKERSLQNNDRFRLSDA